MSIIVIGAYPAMAYAGDAVSWYNKGLALTFSGNYSEAIQAYDHALAIEPNYFEAWNDKADSFNRLKEFDDALAASDRSLAINPDNPKSWINRGYILYNLGKYDEELKAYEKAISLDPNNADAWFNKGYSLGSMGKWDESIKAFDRVEEIDPDYPNFKANSRIAEQHLVASAPLYVKYAPVLAIIVIVVLGSVLWFYMRQKKIITIILYPSKFPFLQIFQFHPELFYTCLH